ncbi:sensor histidine kinase [Sulfurimonas lithotrophica]|uniref:histidine kinase n=1 Tax=Sulfurimonas lithotrophica TaxID=2590022 RepID=A0A5P8P256_9BACT|nr:ATP-binding protein [Sulfurimonas lithotrophica]QFR49764.1 sensor histidine kinase [Sulfurimonas lithotrophica]
MLKIYQLFNIKFVALFVGIMLLTSIVSYVGLKSIIVSYNTENLKNVIKISADFLTKVESLEKFSQKIHDKTKYRVTIIDADGKVIVETNEDKTTMDNHSHRYEVMMANKLEFGESVRYSKTIGVDFLYVAKKIIYKDKSYTLRLSMGLAKVLSHFYELSIKIGLIYIFILVISFYTSNRMSQKIIEDIGRIKVYLDEISNKNYKANLKVKYFHEFLEISLLLKNLVKKLDKRDRQKRKHMAKLRLMNKQRNDILSSISHEFKNPVASIVGYAQTLQDDPDIPLKVRQKFLSKINSNGEKISKMLDRLALSVKLENGDIPTKLTSFNLKELCEEVVTNISLKYRDREISFSAEDIKIKADKTMMELVLTNLVDNALKYSEAQVELKVENGVVYVEDSGIGIHSEHIDKITGKFYRVDKNTWDNSMGIGLAMVSYVLKLHDTALNVKSEPGKGSVFSFSVKSLIV